MRNFTFSYGFGRLKGLIGTMTTLQLVGMFVWFVRKNCRFFYYGTVNRVNGLGVFRKLGKRIKFNGLIRFEQPLNNITIEDDAMLGIGCYIHATRHGMINIGARTSINDHCYITSNYSVDIGDDILIAEFVSIRDFDHEHASLDIPIAMQGLRGGPIRIGNGSWIGRGVIITSGVTIGEGCIVGANAVVTKDIPPWTISVGVPAKVIRSRKT